MPTSKPSPEAMEAARKIRRDTNRPWTNDEDAIVVHIAGIIDTLRSSATGGEAVANETMVLLKRARYYVAMVPSTDDSAGLLATIDQLLLARPAVAGAKEREAFLEAAMEIAHQFDGGAVDQDAWVASRQTFLAAYRALLAAEGEGSKP